MGVDEEDEGKEREGGGLEGGHNWEGGGEEGAVLVGLEKNQKGKMKTITYNSNNQIYNHTYKQQRLSNPNVTQMFYVQYVNQFNLVLINVSCVIVLYYLQTFHLNHSPYRLPAKLSLLARQTIR